MLVPLAAQLITLFHAASSSADGGVVRVEHLLRAILDQPNFGEALRTTLREPAGWAAPGTLPPVSDLQFWNGTQICTFDHDAADVLVAGSELVILGPYQPRHLAAAIGNAAELRPARFTRFGFSARAWQRALAMKSADR